jgi:hypothetical protein
MFRYLLISCILSIGLNARSQDTAKPWTFWWWMGSAVDEKSIEYQLRQFKEAGLGGVHIIPIYGVKGYEQKFTPFLSKRWLELLDYTVKTAKQKKLGVDLTTGTGWPFGGPNISASETSKKFSIQNETVSIEAVGQKVKRAAPGGAGLVVDPFSRASMHKYLQRFDSVFSTSTHGLRSMYCDSYEVFGANWTDSFLNEFKRRRGYALEQHLAQLQDSAQTEANTLVKIDYHQTLSELLLESMKVWTDWSALRNFMTRYQAHGSPGNLLDLYSLASVPETESFGSSNFPIPGLRIDQGYNEKSFGRPNPLAMKFASSAANINGKKLVSSETTTWLADHFTVALSQVKPQVDELFISGINHVFYHGIAYSPKEETYPGWLFYASTNFGPSSAFWKFFPQLNAYVERSQRILQNSVHDNDVLLYFPIADIWSKKPVSSGNVHQLDVHHTERWISNTAFGKTAEELLSNGFAFDYTSDLQLEKFFVKDGKLTNGASVYNSLVIPKCNFIPAETLEQIASFASNGMAIVFIDDFPAAATGFSENALKKEKLASLIKSLENLPNVKVVSSVTKLESVSHERWASKDVRFIRKKNGDGFVYFITNFGSKNFNEGIALVRNSMSVRCYDPLTNTSKSLPIVANGKFLLDLKPGQSCFLFPEKQKTRIATSIDSSFVIPGPWQLRFDEGMPKINFSKTISELTSWTELCDSCAFFSGASTYSTTFDLHSVVPPNQDIIIDMQNVSDVAEVTVNGKAIGTAWSFPFQVVVPAKVLLPAGNKLQIKVANAASNYFRLYDQRNPGWKKFNDINFVNIEYKPYEGAKVKTIPAGLIGNVLIRYKLSK